MIKTVEENSIYEPCIRSYRWLKLKRDYLEQSLSDSLDLTVVGAKFGEGKRTGSYGTLLVASYNTESERWETASLVGTGFTDEVLKTLYEKLKPLALKEPHSDVFHKKGTGSRAVSFRKSRSMSTSLPTLWWRSWLLTSKFLQSTQVAMVNVPTIKVSVFDFLVF